MVPWQVIVIPQFMVITRLKPGRHAFVVDTDAMLYPCSVYFATAVFSWNSIEYSEAAKIDGCSDLRICFNIIVPMAKPGLMTLVIFTFMGTWNDYLAPLIFPEFG